jgi:DNA-binding CsgD family transcriptional regulator
MNKDLTNREREILKLLSEGMSSKQIGNESTVKNQLTIIRQKLNAHTSTHAVAMSIRGEMI